MWAGIVVAFGARDPGLDRLSLRTALVASERPTWPASISMATIGRKRRCARSSRCDTRYYSSVFPGSPASTAPTGRWWTRLRHSACRLWRMSEEVTEQIIDGSRRRPNRWTICALRIAVIVTGRTRATSPVSVPARVRARPLRRSDVARAGVSREIGPHDLCTRRIAWSPWAGLRKPSRCSSGTSIPHTLPGTDESTAGSRSSREASIARVIDGVAAAQAHRAGYSENADASFEGADGRIGRPARGAREVERHGGDRAAGVTQRGRGPGRNAVASAVAAGVPVSCGSTARLEASLAVDGLPLGKSLLVMVQPAVLPRRRLAVAVP